METILLLYVAIGLLLVVVCLPLIKRKIKPNGLYGFRVPQTLNDPDVWYAVNAHFGRRLLVTGIATTLAALLFYRVPGLDRGQLRLGLAGGLRPVLWRWAGAELAVHEDAQQRARSLDDMVQCAYHSLG